MACIYKITNLVNSKIYIGYTSRGVEIRFSEHKKQSRYINKTEKNKRKITPLYKAFHKYGEDKFKIEVLEHITVENWQEKERFYINKYDSTNKKVGYNICAGGEEPPKTYGDKNVRSSLTGESYKGIIYDLQYTTTFQRDIAEKYNVNITTVKRVNNGKIRYNPELDYPLRKKSAMEDITLKIIEDLLNSNLTLKEIAEKHNVYRQRVSDINRGATQSRLTAKYSVPLRKTKDRKYKNA